LITWCCIKYLSLWTGFWLTPLVLQRYKYRICWSWTTTLKDTISVIIDISYRFNTSISHKHPRTLKVFVTDVKEIIKLQVLNQYINLY
jgi:hypothetical protein